MQKSQELRREIRKIQVGEAIDRAVQIIIKLYKDELPGSIEDKCNELLVTKEAIQELLNKE